MRDPICRMYGDPDAATIKADTKGRPITFAESCGQAFESNPKKYAAMSREVGGSVGIPLGWLWFRWGGDVF